MNFEGPESGSKNAELSVWQDDGVLDQIDTAVYVVTEHGVCRRFNRAAETLFGYAQPEVLGKNLHELLHGKRSDGSVYPQHECTLLSTIQSGEAISGLREVMWSHTGEALPVECSVSRVLVQGEPGAVVTAKDLRGQQQAETILQSVQAETAELLRQRDAASQVERELAAAESIRQRELALQVERAATDKLREQQELLKHVVEAAPVGIAVLDPELRFRWYNRACEDMLRVAGVGEEFTGASFLKAVSATEEVARIMAEVKRTGKPYLAVAFPYMGLPNGQTYWNWSVTRLPSRDLLVTLLNVTEQTLAEQALVHSDKMAAVGRLAASISHEINNPLEAVTNLLYLVGCDEALSETSHEYVDMAQTELSRVSRIASQTLRFHRHATEAVTRTHQQLMEPVLALYEGKLKHAKVKVTVDYRDGAPLKTYEGDVRQILNNLIGNAIEAMERGGELRIRMRSMHCVRTGRSGTRVTVTDTGHGMKPETAARVFEPFYTTKGAAGSGLGLWISHTLAERHGGKLAVKSCTEDNELGKPHGTTFSLFLPSQEQVPATIQ